MLVTQYDIAFKEFIQAGLAIFTINRAAVKRIDERPLERACFASAHDEMTRHADALRFKSGTIADGHVSNRQSDRDADTAIQHIVKKAVVRIVVLTVVTAKSLFFKHELVEGFDSGSGLRRYARG